MNEENVTRQQLLKLLQGGNAHMSFDQAVADFPMEEINSHAPNVPYSPWHLLEHLRITQRDILEFIRDPKYKSPPWPEGYWPDFETRADEKQWKETISQFRADHKALEEMVANPDIDLTAPLTHAKRYTITREILTVSDHNAYHIGEFTILRQVMGTWPKHRRM